MARSIRNPNTPEDTRMQRDRLQAEQEEAQQKRTGELTMITAQANANESDGLWDAQTGDLVREGLTEEEKADLERQNAALIGESDEVIPLKQSETGALGEFKMPTDGTANGPNGVPVGERLAEEEDDEVQVARDLKSTHQPAPLPEPVRVGAGQKDRTIQRVERANQTRIIRVNATLDPTIGRHSYHFEKGKRYEVPLHVADHLSEKGYVASFG